MPIESICSKCCKPYQIDIEITYRWHFSEAVILPCLGFAPTVNMSYNSRIFGIVELHANMNKCPYVLEHTMEENQC